MTDVGLISFLDKAGSNLKKLDISETNIALSEVGLRPNTFHNLEELNRYHCWDMTDIGMISFLNKAGSSLKKLNLCFTNITLSEVGLLATTAHHSLEELDLRWC